MPESFGKRQRRDVKAKKIEARDQRRVARAARKRDREAGLIEPGPPLATPEDLLEADERSNEAGPVGSSS